MRTVRILIVTGLLMLALPVSNAFASGCLHNVRSGVLTGDPSTVTAYDKADPNGAPLTAPKLSVGATIYQFNAAATLKFGGNTFVFGAGSVIYLQCEAEARNTPMNRPAIALFKGSVKLTTTATNPGEILLTEGLLTTNPSGPQRVTMQASRTPVSTTYASMMNWFLNYANQPRGTSKVTARPSIDVTPYVGKGVGDCRYFTTKAILNSRGTHLGVKKGANGGGSAKYWKGSKRVS